VKEMISSFLKKLVKSYLESALELFKIEAVICYLNGINAARQLTMLWFFRLFCLILMAVGLGLIPLALCLFTPWTPWTKAIVTLAFAVVYIVVPLVVILRGFSQKRWMKTSGANALVENVLKRK
jgi:heme/copper-type cytochrome/quinol oxidase subunit 4